MEANLDQDVCGYGEGKPAVNRIADDEKALVSTEQSDVVPPQAPRAARDLSEADGLPVSQRRWVMLCILLGVVLASLDSAIANIALPTIARELSASDAATIWVVNGYQLAAAVCLLPAASLGEIAGHKRVYAIGLIVFTIASLGCAMSPNLGVLVAARLAQGAGGACLSALGPALIRGIYPRRILGSGFAMIALAVAISGALGPTIAALILSVATWPWLFLVNLPLCLVAVPLFLAVAPASSRSGHGFDLPGALLNAAALGLVVIGVDALGSSPTGIAVAEIVAGVACAVLLVWQQMRRTSPLLPLDLLRIPVFTLSLGTSVCSYSAQILAYVSVPFMLQTVMHRSPVATGLLVTPWPLLVAFAAPIAGRLSARYPASVLGSVGLAVLASGLLLLALLPAAPPDWDIAWRMGICGVGFGFFQTPNNLTVMTAGPVQRTGAAGGMLAVARTIGWSLGSALVALIFAVWHVGATAICLETAAGFAAFAAFISSLRFFSRRPA
ncbi:MAG: transporter, family, multidrug resistance protein [Acetobacteraceae bacterium]|nr:transporter, family, multidrug resistance protein [Acetobacteraceae bacterium]